MTVYFHHCIFGWTGEGESTNPGWTMLFINAGGVLLETGGTMQHGVSVTRERGKPWNWTGQPRLYKFEAEIRLTQHALDLALVGV